MNTPATCVGPNCTNPPKRGSEYCSTRCRQRFWTLKYRRDAGSLSKADRLKVPRICINPDCPRGGEPFYSASPLAEGCSVECRKVIARELRRSNKTLKPTGRKIILSNLSLAITEEHPATREHPEIDVAEIKNELTSAIWPTKDEHYAFDRRKPKTLTLVEETKRYLAQEGDMSLRHLFYHLVSTIDPVTGEKLLINNQANYANLTGHIVNARLRGDIPTDALLDNARESITHGSWANPAAFRKSVAGAYKIDMWENQETLVEIWTEKDSVVSILENTITEWRVPLRVLRGPSSLTYVDTIAKDWEEIIRPVHVYYLGDHDPAGYTIETSARERLFLLLLEEYGWTIKKYHRSRPLETNWLCAC
jgi:hypothetical protein